MLSAECTLLRHYATLFSVFAVSKVLISVEKFWCPQAGLS